MLGLLRVQHWGKACFKPPPSFWEDASPCLPHPPVPISSYLQHGPTHPSSAFSVVSGKGMLQKKIQLKVSGREELGLGSFQRLSVQTWVLVTSRLSTLNLLRVPWRPPTFILLQPEMGPLPPSICLCTLSWVSSPVSPSDPHPGLVASILGFHGTRISVPSGHFLQCSLMVSSLFGVLYKWYAL